MRKLRSLAVLVLLVAATAAPAAAQGQVEVPWSGGIAEWIGEWMEGVWRAIAGSETGTVDEEPATPPPPVAPADPTTVLVEDDPSTQGNVFPEYDPYGMN